MTFSFARLAPALLAVLIIALDYGARAASGSEAFHLALAILNPAFLFAAYALVPSLFAPFISEGAFKVWLRFITGWIVLSAIVIALAPIYPATGGALHLYATTRNGNARFMGEAGAFLSLVLIAALMLTEHRTRRLG